MAAVHGLYFSACAFTITGDREDTVPCPDLKRMISAITSLVGMTGSGSSVSSAAGMLTLGVLEFSTLNEQA